MTTENKLHTLLFLFVLFLFCFCLFCFFVFFVCLLLLFVFVFFGGVGGGVLYLIKPRFYYISAGLMRSTSRGDFSMMLIWHLNKLQ